MERNTLRSRLKEFSRFYTFLLHLTKIKKNNIALLVGNCIIPNCKFGKTMDRAFKNVISVFSVGWIDPFQ